MEIRAKAKQIRMSPRKIRLVVDLIRGLPVGDALVQLQFCSKAAARPVKKLLESAIANAQHNFSTPKEGLFVKTIAVDAGPVIKRWAPRAFGKATPIRKRMSHISLVLDQSGQKDALIDKKEKKIVVKEKGKISKIKQVLKDKKKTAALETKNE